MFGSDKHVLEKVSGDSKEKLRSHDIEVLDGTGSDDKYGTTQRGLKSRHIQLIALGGCIGTGLFVGTGATLSTAGPAALFWPSL
ncbi:MAG: hypothetical protein Q9221_002169 [Calogaya cf. arnoldii]